MYKIIKEQCIETTYLRSEEKIMDAYLINRYARNDEDKIKLRPIIEDRKAYNKLFDSDDELIEDSNITINYNYFYNRILEGTVSIDDLYKAIEKLIIVEIELKSGEVAIGKNLMENNKLKLGDKIIVRQQSTANNGEIVVALIDDEATVKTFYKERDHIRLQPENSTMEPILVKEVAILGKVVGVIRKM